MTTTTARLFFLAALASVLSFALHAAAPESPESLVGQEVEAPVEAAAAALEDQPLELETPRGSSDDVIVHFGKDSHLSAGQRAEAVIAIVGSASSDGEVDEALVSIFGNTRVGGPTNGAVAVFGDTYVNSRVREDAVAVFGNLELGPQAEVYGNVVAVGGVVKRDPAAVVHGGVQEISFPVAIGRVEWLHPWLKHCLLLGRPLALEPGLGWAWSLAFGFLALYVFIALLFPGSVEKCVATLETRPGHSMLASLLAMFVSPVLMVMLAITVVGIALIPFAWMALFCAGIFGKVVILGALGRRMTRFIGAGPLSHIAFPVFLGGFILIGMYLVPFFGFIVYKLTGVVGLGVVLYTLLLAFKSYRESSVTPTMAMPAGAPPIIVNSEFSEGATPSPSDAATVTSGVASTLPRAGFWIRMAALFVDGLLIAIALGALQNSSDAWLIVLAAYGAAMWKIKGTTVGGILCNIQVVRVDGRDIDWPTAIVRALSCFLSMAAVGLGFLWIVFDNDRQAWHDKIAGTVVVRVPRGVSLI